jgi:hypothetical protein
VIEEEVEEEIDQNPNFTGNLPINNLRKNLNNPSLVLHTVEEEKNSASIMSKSRDQGMVSYKDEFQDNDLDMDNESNKSVSSPSSSYHTFK